MNKKFTEIKNFKDFLIKNTIIASALTFLLGAQIKHLSSTILDALIDPLFSIDLDNNGEPDLQQLKRMTTNILGFKFPFGKIISEFIKAVLTIVILYFVVSIFIKYTKLI
tara:strand:- start:458 stop:787 length:330 start_codon:yes stop_codon:yes gene_type:complete